MKKLWILTALAIMAGCTQDTSNNTFQSNSTARPSWISGDIPDIQAVILEPDESNQMPEGASLRSTSVCSSLYVLQIRRISTHGGQIALRVFTKDADDEGFSAVINIMDLNSISTSAWVTILLYDEDNNEICFDTGDNLIFIQPFYFDEDIEFEVRLYNASGMSNTTPETILWDAYDRFYFTNYPLSGGYCQNSMPDYCCEYEFTSDEVSTAYGGIMKFRSVWDNDWINLPVPPEAIEPYTSDNCGPIAVIWDTIDHLNTEGYGSVNFECDNTFYDWLISDNQTYHGVIFDPNGRICYLRY